MAAAGEPGALLLATVLRRPYVFAFLACFLVLAIRQAGWRRMLTFALPTWALAFAAEYSSTRNGFPFGPYAYDESARGLELWLANVPSWDSLSFVFLSWFSLVLAAAVLTPRARRSEAPWPALLHPATPLLGGLLMTVLDVVIDPVTLQGEKWFLGRVYAYPWHGFWFGVTAANFAGWWLVGAVSQWTFQALHRAAPWCRGPWPAGSPLLAWAAYGVYAGVLGFMLAVTAWIGDGPLLAASGAVSLATLAALAAGLRRAGRAGGEVLVCAATGTEARACRAAGARVEVLRTGVGPDRAAEALRARLARGPRPALVVSSGFAGARSEGLPLHAALTAGALARVHAPDARDVPLAPPPGRLRVAAGARACLVLSGAALERRTAPAGLAAQAESAVDMESAALAGVAWEGGLAFAVLRVVTDTPATPFPAFADHLAAALAARRPGARLASLARALAGALRAPRQALAFARSSLRAARVLAALWREGGAGLLETAPDAPGVGAATSVTAGPRAASPLSGGRG